MGIIESASIIIIILISLICVYRLGIGEGRHVERMNLIDVISSIDMKDMLPEQRFSVICTINHIISKLRER